MSQKTVCHTILFDKLLPENDHDVRLESRQKEMAFLLGRVHGLTKKLVHNTGCCKRPIVSCWYIKQRILYIHQKRINVT